MKSRAALLLSAIVTVTLYGSQANAIDMDDFVGYTVIHSGKITGYIDEDGKRDDSFEGCEYGRKLIIDDR